VPRKPLCALRKARAPALTSPVKAQASSISDTSAAADACGEVFDRRQGALLHDDGSDHLGVNGALVSRAAEQNSPLSLTTVCGSWSLFVQVTVEPAATVSEVGANMKSSAIAMVAPWTAVARDTHDPRVASSNALT
jgi:hypothetical protein